MESVKTACKKLYDKPFEELSWNEQTDFLKQFEKGEDRSFFSLIRDNTMQGYYGSPRHGGNKDYVSYRMLGLDYPVIEGQNRYDK